MIRILLIEDEDAIREAEAAYLRNAGYTVFEAAAGASVLQQFEVVTPHAIVLDLSLPSIYGLAYVPHDTSRVRKPP
jgi:DNA-binding response OmpR family regulator